MDESITYTRRIVSAHESYFAVPTLDQATVDWVNSVVAAGGSVSNERKIYINNLIVGLKSDGVWAELDRLWLFAAENTTSALRDLVARVAATTAGTPTFTANTGYEGTASGDFIESGFRPSTAGGLYTLNDCHQSVWCVSTASQTAQLMRIASQSVIYPQNTADSKQYCALNSGNASTGFLVASARGHVLGSRTASNNTDAYRDGSSIGVDATASVSLSANTIQIGNFFGTNPNQFAAISFGGSFTAGQALSFYTRLRTYMTAVGVP